MVATGMSSVMNSVMLINVGLLALSLSLSQCLTLLYNIHLLSFSLVRSHSRSITLLFTTTPILDAILSIHSLYSLLVEVSCRNSMPLFHLPPVTHLFRHNFHYMFTLLTASHSPSITSRIPFL